MKAQPTQSERGSGLAGVIVAGALSCVLGVALCAAVLVITPVPTVKERPKDAPAEAIYYIPGSAERAKGGQWQRKEQQFVAGSAVNVVEDDLNLAIAAQTVAPAPKAEKPAKAGASATPPSPPQALNFRIRDGVFQIGAPVPLAQIGLSDTVPFQARGEFVRKGDQFVFDAREVYLGACPLHKLPGAADFVMKRLGASAREQLPPEFQAAWARVNSAVIEGDTLQLSTQ